MTALPFEQIDTFIVGKPVEIRFPDGASSNHGSNRLMGVVATVQEFGTARIVTLVGSNDPVLIQPKLKKLFSKDLVEPRGNPQVFLT